MRKMFSLTLAFALVFGLAVTLATPAVAEFSEAPQSQDPIVIETQTGETIPFWLFPSDFASCSADCGNGVSCTASGPNVSCSDGGGCSASNSEIEISYQC